MSTSHRRVLHVQRRYLRHRGAAGFADAPRLQFADPCSAGGPGLAIPSRERLLPCANDPSLRGRKSAAPLTHSMLPLHRLQISQTFSEGTFESLDVISPIIRGRRWPRSTDCKSSNGHGRDQRALNRELAHCSPLSCAARCGSSAPRTSLGNPDRHHRREASGIGVVDRGDADKPAVDQAIQARALRSPSGAVGSRRHPTRAPFGHGTFPELAPLCPVCASIR